jgi:TrmH family RNA methyltransferase
LTTPVLSRRSHPVLQTLRAVRDGKDRALLFVEGVKTVAELFTAGLPVRDLFATPRRREHPETAALFAEAARRNLPVTLLDEDVMAFASDLHAPPGLIALAERPAPAGDDDTGAGLALVLGPLQSPANAGAILRVAEAAGVRDVWPIQGGTDLWGPKALRAAAGSAFRLSLHRSASWEERLAALRAAGRRLVAADPRGTVTHDAWDWAHPMALILGAEAGRMPEDLFAREGVQGLRIAMAGSVESLNVAVAAGILLFEAKRHRG